MRKHLEIFSAQMIGITAILRRKKDTGRGSVGLNPYPIRSFFICRDACAGLWRAVLESDFIRFQRVRKNYDVSGIIARFSHSSSLGSLIGNDLDVVSGNKKSLWKELHILKDRHCPIRPCFSKTPWF